MAATATQDLKDIKSQLEAANAQIAELSKPKQQSKSMLGGFAQHADLDNRGWLKPEKLMQLSKAYEHDAVAHELIGGRGGRRTRGIGMGPALKMMAEMELPQLNGQYRNTTQQQFEDAHGFTSLEVAKNRGRKMLSGAIHKTALAENSGVTGGYIIPPQFMTELMTIAAEDAFIEPRAKVIPMLSRTMQIPVLNVTARQATGVSPYYAGLIGYWQPEAASLNESEPAFLQTEWTAWDLTIFAISSNQLLEDNGIGLDALLSQLFASAVTWYSEYAFLQGLGSGQKMPIGILNAPATYTQIRTTSSKFYLADAANMMAHLQVRSWDTACWIMHQSVLPQLIQMNDYGAPTAGAHLVWSNPMPNGGVNEGPSSMKLPQAFLNGLPVYFTEKVPSLGTTGDVMLVDWSKYIIGKRMDLQIAVSGEYLFRNNQLAWRVWARMDGKPFLNNTIVDAEGFTISPFVVLSSATS